MSKHNRENNKMRHIHKQIETLEQHILMLEEQRKDKKGFLLRMLDEMISYKYKQIENSTMTLHT